MGMLDGLISRLNGGHRVDPELETRARETLDAARADGSPAAVFGLSVAESLGGLRDRDLARLLPGVDAGDTLPPTGAARTARIYETARDAASAHVSGGDNAGLGVNVGRSARRAALLQVAGLDDVRARAGRGDLTSLLSRETGEIAADVRRYLDGTRASNGAIYEAAELVAPGSAAEGRLAVVARSMGTSPVEGAADRSAWMRSTLLMEQGLARAGVLSPDDLVAVATSREHVLPRRDTFGADRPGVSMPNFAVGQAVGVGSREMIDLAARHSGVTTPYHSVDNDASKVDPRRAHEVVAQAPARAAMLLAQAGAER